MPSSTLAHTTLPLTNLGRSGAVDQEVAREVARVNGVARVCISPLIMMAYVEYDAALCSHAQLTAAVERAGHGGRTP